MKGKIHKKKLGSWQQYLEMREIIMKANEEIQPMLSKDLGAISGLLFDIGVGKIVLNETWASVLKFEKSKLEKVWKKRHNELEQELLEENEHLKIQVMLTEIGIDLGYNVYVAKNDRKKSLDGKSLEFLTVSELPPLDLPYDVVKTISLIDVIWINKDTNEIECAFEIEKSTSIYSGILRLYDLATSLGDRKYNFFLVAPNSREKEIIAQLKRPAFRNLSHLELRYILFSDLKQDCESICKFGDDYKILLKLAKGIG